MRVWLALAAGVVSALPMAGAAQETNREIQFYVLGEKYPRGLGDFQAFGLFRGAGTGHKAKLTGWVMSNREDPNNSTVDMIAVRLQGKRLTFSTKARGGLVFTFDGQFLKSGDFTRYANKQIPVIEGKVTKLRRGRKVAAAQMRFTCGFGG